MIGSGLIQRKMAEGLGLTNLAGKPMDLSSRQGAPNFTNEIDNLVSGDNLSIFGLQHEPSIAVNPFNQNIVVVVGHNEGSSLSGNSNDCAVYTSLDGGQTYAYTQDVPLFATTFVPGAIAESCSDPVVRFSPDGTAMYVSILDVGSDALGIVGDVVWLFTYDGFDPNAGITSGNGFLFTGADFGDKEWIDVHTWDADGSGAANVYMTFTRFTATNCDIMYSRSTNHGASISPAVVMASSTTCDPLLPALSSRVLQGSRPAAGPGQQVIACWFDAGTDGWSIGAQTLPPPLGTAVVPLNKFNIACRTSNDRGLTFAGDVNPPESVTPADPTKWLYAAKAIANETSFWMGPNANFFRTSAGPFPSVTIDHKGMAHIVYGYNPGSGNRFKVEQGNIGYVRSAFNALAVPFIYPTWLKTVAASGFGGQFFPTVTSQKVWESPTPYIYIGWNDTTASRTLGAANANSAYDVRYRLSKRGGVGLGRPVIVTEHASVSDFVFIGDYIDSSATPGIYHIVWTDNRYGVDVFTPRTKFFADRY